MLTVSANPTSIETGGATSTITADMTKNSAGQDTSAQGHIPDGTEIIFTTTAGSIGSTAVTKTTTNGIAKATLTSSNAEGTATVCAEAPHASEVPEAQYKACTKVSFVAPPKPTVPEQPRWPSVLPDAAYCYVSDVYVDPVQTLPGQAVVITVKVRNTGRSSGNYTVNLTINGQVEQTRTVAIPPVSIVPVRFTIYKGNPGTCTVDVEGHQRSFIILPTTTQATSAVGSAGSWTLGTGSIIAIVVIALIIISRAYSRPQASSRIDIQTLTVSRDKFLGSIQVVLPRLTYQGLSLTSASQL